MDYSCDRCGYETDVKKNMLQHLRRKFPCDPIISNIDRNKLIEKLTVKTQVSDNGFVCVCCNKSFSSRQGKHKHQKICKKNPSDIIETLQLAIKELANRGNTMNNDSSNHHNNHSNNVTTNNNTTINIEIRDFGHENMAALPDHAIRDNIIFLRFIEILEMLHFDEEYPENRNFKLISLKNQIMQFYRGKKWEACSMQRGIDEIIMHVCRIYRTFFHRCKDDIIEDSDEDDARKLIEEIELIYNLDKRRVKDIRKDIRALLYNYKENSL